MEGNVEESGVDVNMALREQDVRSGNYYLLFLQVIYLFFLQHLALFLHNLSFRMLFTNIDKSFFFATLIVHLIL